MPAVKSQVGFVGKTRELDFTPFKGQTTVENAAERLTALQERLCDRPLNILAIADTFGFNLQDKKVPNPLFLHPLYPSPVQTFYAGVKLTPSTVLDWNASEGQYMVFSMKYGIEMHKWGEETIKQVLAKARQKYPYITHATSRFWHVKEQPECSGQVSRYTGSSEEILDKHFENISCFFGLHLAFLGQGRNAEPKPVVCVNPIQTQTIRNYHPDDSGVSFLDRVMLEVLDTQLALTKGKPDMSDVRAHWGNQRRLIRNSTRNIFYPQDKQLASIPLMHYACNTLGVDTLGYYDYFLDNQPYAEAYGDYELMSRIAVEVDGRTHNPNRIVKYGNGMRIKDD